MDEAITKARAAQGRHTFGHTNETGVSSNVRNKAEVIDNEEDAGATRQDRTGDLLITNQPLYQLS